MNTKYRHMDPSRGKMEGDVGHRKDLDMESRGLNIELNLHISKDKMV
jgi:hypothetical protein